MKINDIIKDTDGNYGKILFEKVTNPSEIHTAKLILAGNQ